MALRRSCVKPVPTPLQLVATFYISEKTKAEHIKKAVTGRDARSINMRYFESKEKKKNHICKSSSEMGDVIETRYKQLL